MDAMQQQAMHIARDARRQQRHTAFLAALKLMDAGDYGYCHQCDEMTGVGRLAIEPAFTLCVNCAQRCERLTIWAQYVGVHND